MGDNHRDAKGKLGGMLGKALKSYENSQKLKSWQEVLFGKPMKFKNPMEDSALISLDEHGNELCRDVGYGANKIRLYPLGSKKDTFTSIEVKELLREYREYAWINGVSSMDLEKWIKSKNI